MYLGLAPRPGREQQKTVIRQSLNWLDRKITAAQRPKQSVCSWLPIGRVMKEKLHGEGTQQKQEARIKNKKKSTQLLSWGASAPLVVSAIRHSRCPCSSCRACEAAFDYAVVAIWATGFLLTHRNLRFYDGFVRTRPAPNAASRCSAAATCPCAPAPLHALAQLPTPSPD